MTLRPTARDVGEHRQHRQFIIVIPKNERIVPEQKKTEEDDDKSCRYRARNFRTRGARSGHLTQKTPNAQRRTQRERISFGLLSAVRMLATKIRISSSTSLRQTVKFAGVPRFFTRPTSRNQRFVSRSSLRQIRSL